MLSNSHLLTIMSGLVHGSDSDDICHVYKYSTDFNTAVFDIIEFIPNN